MATNVRWWCCSQMNLTKGQISKLLVFDIIIGGHSKSIFNVEGGGGSLKCERKWTSGGGQAYLCIHSVKKIDWFFWVLSDKLLGSC